MISISVRVDRLQSSLNDVGRQQLPFGLSLGINKTLTDIQAMQRRGLSQRFVLRKAAFVQSVVNIRKEDFATKASLVGRVRIGGLDQAGPGRKRFGAELARHEAGGVFHEGYFIPTRVLRPSFSQSIERKMFPSSLGLWRTDRQIAAGTAGDVQRRGKHRTFSIINRQGEFVGIFQRFGMKMSRSKRAALRGLAARGLGSAQLDDGIRLIWARKQSIRLRPRLQFADTARLVTRSRLALNVEAGMLRALRTARPR